MSLCANGTEKFARTHLRMETTSVGQLEKSRNAVEQREKEREREREREYRRRREEERERVLVKEKTHEQGTIVTKKVRKNKLK